MLQILSAVKVIFLQGACVLHARPTSWSWPVGHEWINSYFVGVNFVFFNDTTKVWNIVYFLLNFQNHFISKYLIVEWDNNSIKGSGSCIEGF